MASASQMGVLLRSQAAVVLTLLAWAALVATVSREKQGPPKAAIASSFVARFSCDDSLAL